jgi:hypothetical protein
MSGRPAGNTKSGSQKTCLNTIGYLEKLDICFEYKEHEN